MKLKRLESDQGIRLHHVFALNAEVAANLGNLQECDGSPICMEVSDDCGDHHVQLVAKASGLGSTPSVYIME